MHRYRSWADLLGAALSARFADCFANQRRGRIFYRLHFDDALGDFLKNGRPFFVKGLYAASLRERPLIGGEVVKRPLEPVERAVEREPHTVSGRRQAPPPVEMTRP